MFFNKYKEKIADLERENYIKQTRIDSLNLGNEELKKQISGERRLSSYCYACKNMVRPEYPQYGPVCKLDVKCKDFKDKEK